MSDDDHRDDGIPEPEQDTPHPDSEPEIYAVRRGESGWSFTRRSFLAAMGAAAAGATAQAAGRRDTESVSRRAPKARRSSTKTLENETKVIEAAHRDVVRSLGLSHDGKTLVSGSYDGTVKLWELPMGAHFKTIAARQQKVFAVATSGNGDHVLSGGEDGNLRLWLAQDGQLVRTFPMPGKVWGVAVDPSGMFAACACAGSRDVCVFGIGPNGNGKLLLEHTSEVLSVAVSPDGNLLASGTRDGEITIRELPEGKLIQNITTRASGIYTLAFAPRGSTLIAGSPEGAVAIFEEGKQDPVMTWSTHVGRVYRAVFLGESGHVAVAGDAPDILIYDQRTGKGLQSLRGHRAAVMDLVATPDGSSLVSASADCTIRLWSLGEGVQKLNMTDLESTSRHASGRRFSGVSAQHLQYTLPCSAPLPPGATCVCDCIPGSLVGVPTWSCTCDTVPVCTCDRVTVCSCDTVPVCSCDKVRVCSCDTICTCNQQGGGGGGGTYYVTYMYPN